MLPETLEDFSAGGTRLEEFPTCDLFPQNIKKLTLVGLGLGWDAISTIGKQLRNLEVLKLITNGCDGTSWDLEDGDFPNLRILILNHLWIEKINVSSCDNLFPGLEKLLVEFCPSLEEIPSNFGDICGLNTIKVYRSSSGASASARRILEEQRAMGNDSLQIFVTEE